MKFNTVISPILIVMLQAILLAAGCGNQSGEVPENDSHQNPEWGREVDLDEMIALSKKGRIKEIQWHVMPNVLRAQAVDGKIYHLRNENKGVDLQNALIKAGVKIGEDGVLFRHVF